MKKVMILFLSVVLFACSSQNVNVVLETDGKEYKIMDNVSFYYPKSFKMNLTADSKEDIYFVDEDEVYKYIMLMNNSDNNIEDYPHLYLGQLQEDGAIDAEYSSIVLENQMQCYEYTGLYKLTGIKFKQVVYFTNDATYVYVYEAAEEIFDEMVNVATQYLRSLTVHNEQVS